MTLDHKIEVMPFKIEDNILKGRVVPYIPQYTSIGKSMFDILKKNANFVGQVDGVTGVEDTFADIADRAIKCALWLKQQGVVKGDVIAVATHNHPNCFIPCIAASFIGAISNLWHYELSLEDACHLMKSSEPKVIFANEESAGVICKAAKNEDYQTKIVVFGSHPGTIPYPETLNGHSKSAVDNFECTELDDDNDTAVIFCTSGSTGRPKGVQVSNRMLLNMVQKDDPARAFSSSIPLWFGSQSWVTATSLTFMSIFHFRRRIIGPSFEEKTACEIIQKFKVTWLFLNTSMGNRLIRYPHLHKYDLSSVRTVAISGAPMIKESQDLWKKMYPKTMVLQAYGMTECGMISCQTPQFRTSGSCGTVFENNEIKMIDVKTKKALGPNQVGEVCVMSDYKMSGYLKNPEETRCIIDEEGWLHTGDLAYYSERGEIFIVDRLKELIKYRTHHVTPTELETILYTHPSILEVAVVGVPHVTDDEHPMAFVSKVPDMEVTAEELIDMIANNLNDYCKLRGGVKFLPHLPHLPSGKISRRELKVMAKSVRSL